MVLRQRQNWITFVLRAEGRSAKGTYDVASMVELDNICSMRLKMYVVVSKKKTQCHTSQICFAAGFVHDCEICLCHSAKPVASWRHTRQLLNNCMPATMSFLSLGSFSSNRRSK